MAGSARLKRRTITNEGNKSKTNCEVRIIIHVNGMINFLVTNGDGLKKQGSRRVKSGKGERKVVKTTVGPVKHKPCLTLTITDVSSKLIDLVENVVVMVRDKKVVLRVERHVLGS